MGWHMATIDLKDFYSNGTPDQIIEAILTLWAADDPMKDVLHRVLDFVLRNQYVDDPWEGSDNLTYHVLEGSGMGLGHSGEVADCTLVALMERRVVTAGAGEKFAHHGVRAYWRFRDDILLLSGGLASSTMSLFMDMQALAPIYPMKITWAWREVQFLDLL